MTETVKSHCDFFEVEKKYFIRTATYHHVGLLIGISEHDLVLSGASWVADSGRFNNALKTGDISELEPFVNNILINRDAIIDATEWGHGLFDAPRG